MIFSRNYVDNLFSINIKFTPIELLPSGIRGKVGKGGELNQQEYKILEGIEPYFHFFQALSPHEGVLPDLQIIKRGGILCSVDCKPFRSSHESHY